MQRFPGIGFRTGEMGRRAYAQGSHLDVWQIIENLQAFGGIEELCKDTHLTRRQVELALAYYDAYPDEIDSKIAANQITLEEARRRLPGLLIEEVP